MEVVGAFNPGAILSADDQDGDGEVVLLVRVAERPKARQPGRTALPRWEPGQGIVVDQVHNDELEMIDARVVRKKADGALRLTFISHLRVMRSRDGRTIDALDGPRFVPETKFETYGVEDPRITRIDGRYYITYVAVSVHGAATALASTSDFQTFERHGIIFCPENKDVVLFPEKIGGRYTAIHRPNPSMHFSPPAMWLARSDDLMHWGGHEPLLTSTRQAGQGVWDAGRVGAGCPPLLTPCGWLEVYHGNNQSQQRDGTDKGVGAYFGAAFLMDADEPRRIVGHSGGPILAPQEEFETDGFLPNVVFPTALVQRGEIMLIYYGAADAHTGVVGFDRGALLAACTDNRRR